VRPDPTASEPPLHPTECARAEAAAIVRDHPDFSLERYAESQPFRDAAQRAAYLQILSSAGLPG